MHQPIVFVRLAAVACILTLTSNTWSHELTDGTDVAASGLAQDAAATSTAIATTRPGADLLSPAKEEDGFQFIVFGDRTSGVPEGLEVLKQAVIDSNLLDPDLVMTVGDLVQGYNEQPQWLEQVREYKAIMNNLRMRWYPVAGNHDIYWRGNGPTPEGHHEADYEQHLGPLWYCFRHKNAGFVVLFSDEGDRSTNRKGFNQGELQRMSDEQLKFLEQALSQLQSADHVFVFLHHPRWIGGGYSGGNWDVVHKMLTDAGNVSAVFSGHIHHMRYDGPKDGIEYYTLATTGGNLNGDIPGAGYLHHLNLVTVRRDRISVSTLPVGTVIAPQQFTADLLQKVELARSVRPVQTSPAVVWSADGSVDSEVVFAIENRCPRMMSVAVRFDGQNVASQWQSTLDQDHFRLDPGAHQEITFHLQRARSETIDISLPVVRLQPEFLGDQVRIRLPEVETPIQFVPEVGATDFFDGTDPHCLLVTDAQSAVRVDAAKIPLPDGPMTLEAWVRPHEQDGTRGIIAKTQGSEYAFFAKDGVPKFDIFLNGRYVSAVAKDKLTANDWTHLAGVYDGEQVKLFVNGKQVDSKAAAGSRKINELPLYIGADPNERSQPTRPFSGLLDEVRLSASAVYLNDFIPTPRIEPGPNTLLLLHLDKHVGPFVLDHSPAHANGTLGATSTLVQPDHSLTRLPGKSDVRIAE